MGALTTIGAGTISLGPGGLGDATATGQAPDGSRSRRWGDPWPTRTTTFFEGLAGGQSIAVVGAARGSIRFDLREGRHTDHWRVELGRDSGERLRPMPRRRAVRAERSVFDELASGRLSALPAVLRGLLDADGDASLVVHFQRLFPVVEHRADAGSARTVGRRRG